MLEAMPCRRQTSAAEAPGASDSATMVCFSVSLNVRRGATCRTGSGGRVKFESTACSLAALLVRRLTQGLAAG